VTASLNHAPVSGAHDDESFGSHFVNAPTTKSADALGSALREQASLADRRSSVELSLALLWKELARGLCRIEACFFDELRCYLVTTPVASQAAPMEGRRLQILEAILCGLGQKNIAIELSLAPSTVALNARLGIEALGLHCKPSRVPPLLMLAAKSARDHDAAVTASLSFVEFGGRELRVVGIPRPDRSLLGVLPPAELAVVRNLVEGHSYAEIARRRGTSARTIANQIAAGFRRLRVSGRSELLLRLFFASGLGRGSVPLPMSETLPPRSTSETLPPRSTSETLLQSLSGADLAARRSSLSRSRFS
jgi:DNA-binding NarL/FixJ family response regulator